MSSPKKIVFTKSESYAKFFRDYLAWCKVKKVNPLTKDPKSIKTYLKDLSKGYPSYEKPRKPQTLKIKLNAIKCHYELNHKEDLLDFETEFDSKFFKKFAA